MDLGIWGIWNLQDFGKIYSVRQCLTDLEYPSWRQRWAIHTVVSSGHHDRELPKLTGLENWPSSILKHVNKSLTGILFAEQIHHPWKEKHIVDEVRQTLLICCMVCGSKQLQSVLRYRHQATWINSIKFNSLTSVRFDQVSSTRM